MFFLDELPFFERAGRWLAAMLCQAIYPLIAFLFDLFYNISKVNILSGKDIQPIYQRITLILTIVMVFYVTFEFVKFVVQPDGITDKEKGVGNIVYRMVLVVVLIAFVPKIFDYAYQFQHKIIDSEIISKIIVGNAYSSTKASMGGNFSANIFSMFYKAEENVETDWYRGIVNQNLYSLRYDNDLSQLSAGLSYNDVAVNNQGLISSEEGDDALIPGIVFDWPWAIGVGVFIAYILLIYCIDLGVRWAQLLFLQIMAPIAIIGYLAPKKEGIFQKWIKQCVTTYVDLFIRIAIMYFVALICSILAGSFTSNELFSNLGNVGDTMKTFIYIVLVLGLLLFMKKAPELLKELFPKTSAASGNFGLKAGARVPSLAARTLGGALGASRAITGAIGRARRAAARKKAAGLDNKEGREQHKKEKQEKNLERRKALEAEKRQKKYGKAYETANTLNKEKKQKLDEAGKEYTKARKARIQAEAEGKPKAEIDKLRAQEAEARKKAVAAAAEYKPTIAPKNELREKVMGTEAYEAEKERRRQEAIAAGQERQKLKEQNETVEKATSEAEKAQQEYEDKSSKLSKAEQEENVAQQAVNEAQARKTQAEAAEQSATQERDAIRAEIGLAEEELASAKAAGLTDVQEIAKMEGNLGRLRKQESLAQDRITTAQQEYSRAQTDETAAIGELNTKKTAREAAKQEADQALSRQEQTQQEKRTAETDKNSIESSIRSKLDSMKITKAPENHERAMIEASTKREQAESDVKELINKERGTSITEGVVGGIIGGGYHGISHGIQATKLSEIPKKVSEGYSADRKSMDAVQNYYDTGGTKTWVGRTVEKLDRGVIGGPTQYHNTQYSEIKPLEDQIKQLESSSSLEADVKTKLDAVKDRGEAKIQEGKIKTTAEGFDVRKALKIPANQPLPVDTSKAATISDVYSEYKKYAEKMAGNSAGAAQEYQRQLAMQIPGEPASEKAARIKKAEENANAAASRKVDAERYLDEIKKKGTEFAFTQILRNPNISGADEVMIQKVEDMQQSIVNARNNAQTINAFETYAKNEYGEYIPERKVLLDAFKSGIFSDFTQLEDVQKVLTEISNNHNRIISARKEQKRQIEVSAKTQAEKADADFSGGSGK